MSMNKMPVSSWLPQKTVFHLFLSFLFLCRGTHVLNTCIRNLSTLNFCLLKQNERFCCHIWWIFNSYAENRSKFYFSCFVFYSQGKGRVQTQSGLSISNNRLKLRSGDELRNHLVKLLSGGFSCDLLCLGAGGRGSRKASAYGLNLICACLKMGKKSSLSAFLWEVREAPGMLSKLLRLRSNE